jgi:crossover junction endodeoxyribonuclease RuvC
MTYVGIDPGAKGAFAILDNGTVDVLPLDMEEFTAAMRRLDPKQTRVVLEHVSAMPGQGVVSMFTFGTGWGRIMGVLEALRIPYELVKPQKWKKAFSVTGDKNSSIAVAKRLYPGIDLRRTERSRKDDDGLAEALLMAEYARRTL